MSIHVICPGCKKRFQVSEKFAGKKGPCPKCKAEITIPSKSEEVKVHAPESFGPKDSQGRSVLKPIFREEARISIPEAAVVAGSLLLILLLAILVRFRYQADEIPLLLLALGAVLLAPPLVYAGYSFLRDDELEPHRGPGLWIRTGLCALGFAALWGVLSGYMAAVGWTGPLEIYGLAVVVPLMMVAGAGISLVTLDLDFGAGFFHYGLYLSASVLLRLLMNLGAFP